MLFQLLIFSNISHFMTDKETYLFFIDLLKMCCLIHSCLALTYFVAGSGLED